MASGPDAQLVDDLEALLRADALSEKQTRALRWLSDRYVLARVHGPMQAWRCKIGVTRVDGVRLWPEGKPFPVVGSEPWPEECQRVRARALDTINRHDAIVAKLNRSALKPNRLKVAVRTHRQLIEDTQLIISELVAMGPELFFPYQDAVCGTAYYFPAFELAQQCAIRVAHCIPAGEEHAAFRLQYQKELHGIEVAHRLAYDRVRLAWELENTEAARAAFICAQLMYLNQHRQPQTARDAPGATHSLKLPAL